MKKPSKRRPATKKAATKTAVAEIKRIGVDKVFAATLDDATSAGHALTGAVSKALGAYFQTFEERAPTQSEAVFAVEVLTAAIRATVELERVRIEAATANPPPSPGDDAHDITNAAQEFVPGLDQKMAIYRPHGGTRQ